MVAFACCLGISSAAQAAPPANDNFAGGQIVGPALPLEVPASNVEATAEVGEPAIGGNAALRSIWFRWTAPAAGTVVVNLCGSGFTGSESPFEAVAVRTGAALNALVLVAETAGNCSLRFTAVAGIQYKIQVDYRNDQGNFTFRMRQLTPPANDNFVSSTVIGPGLPINVQGTTVDSGWQVGEPAALGGSTSSRSVWFTWVAPATEQVRADFCTYTLVSGAANRTIGVYTGNNPAGLVQVIPPTNNCEVTFNAVAGTTYRIAFSGSISGELNFALNLKSAPPPSNDNFANAITVGPGLPILAQGNNEFATVEAGEPDHSGPGFDAARSLWYQWTAGQSQRVKLKACNRDDRTRIGVYTGASVNALTNVAEYPGFAPHCSVLLNAVAGTTYRIAAAGGPQDGAYGPFELDIHALNRPPNDDFADAITIGPLPVNLTGSVVDASVEENEPSHALGSYSDRFASVWYRWTATSVDPVLFSACSSTEPVRIAVYSGTALDDLEQIASSGKGCAEGSQGGRLAIAPDPGVTYLIAVAAENRNYESGFTLKATGSTLIPPVVEPPAGFNLKKAIKQCKKIKSKKKRAACIRKARKKDAIIKCRKIVNPANEAKCIRKAKRTFR